ncbi:MAG TPA: putative zinc-binding protein [Ignavibacteriaceae bacterium]|nr:putative zinc-binding protein [Ignavibacteriaceae bacterium]
MDKNRFNKIVVACSGASNTGAYSDRVARKLMKDGNAKMLCLARFAVDDKFVEQTKNEITNYEEILVIDGCPINCAEKIIEKLELTNYKHINITNFGIEKGKTPLMEEKINELVDYIMKLN